MSHLKSRQKYGHLAGHICPVPTYMSMLAGALGHGLFELGGRKGMIAPLGYLNCAELWSGCTKTFLKEGFDISGASTARYQTQQSQLKCCFRVRVNIVTQSHKIDCLLYFEQRGPLLQICISFLI